MIKPISELKRVFDTVHTGYNEYSWLLYLSSASAILANYLGLTAGISAISVTLGFFYITGRAHPYIKQRRR